MIALNEVSRLQSRGRTSVRARDETRPSEPLADPGTGLRVLADSMRSGNPYAGEPPVASGTDRPRNPDCPAPGRAMPAITSSRDVPARLVSSNAKSSPRRAFRLAPAASSDYSHGTPHASACHGHVGYSDLMVLCRGAAPGLMTSWGMHSARGPRSLGAQRESTERASSDHIKRSIAPERGRNSRADRESSRAADETDDLG